jgi:DNA-binding GntR family transcriptional regulator
MTGEDALKPINENRQTVQDLVLDSIRKAIIAGQLRPGRRLTVQELASELGVSTMPVRHALSVLEVEGYITHTPHRAFEVASTSAEEAETIYLIRVRLEPLAAELVAARHAEEDVKHLRSLCDEIEEAIEKNDFDLFLKRDGALHDALYEGCRRAQLAKLIEDVRHSAQRYRHLYNLGHQSQAEMRQTQSEHRQLIQAIAGNDPHLAGQMIAAGLHRWIRGLLEVLTPDQNLQDHLQIEE